MKELSRLTDLELNILKILWDQNTALSVAEISDIQNVSVASVNQVINKLLKKNLVQIEEIVMVKKSLTRKFAPKITREAYIESELDYLLSNSSNNRQHSAKSMVTAMLNINLDLADKNLLQTLKNKLEKD